MKLLSGFAVVTTVALVCWTDSKLDQWEEEQQVMSTDLLSSLDETSRTPLQDWDDLPASVQQYLNQVLPGSMPQTAKALLIQQEGEFLLKKDQYVPFTSSEAFAISPPGFSWEGKIAMAPFAPSWFPKLFVRDSWVFQREGRFQAAVQAILPIMCLDTTSGDKSFDDEMTLGQATRWLADAVLLPSSLHPKAGIVTWKSVGSGVDENGALRKVILELPIVNIRGLQLEASFDDDTGLLKQVIASKPFLLPKGNFETKTWQVNFFDYQRQANGMTVPIKMESGWINDEGDFEVHYKIENRLLQYHYADHTNQEEIVVDEMQ